MGGRACSHRARKHRRRDLPTPRIPRDRNLEPRTSRQHPYQYPLLPLLALRNDAGKHETGGEGEEENLEDGGEDEPPSGSVVHEVADLAACEAREDVGDEGGEGCVEGDEVVGGGAEGEENDVSCGGTGGQKGTVRRGEREEVPVWLDANVPKAEYVPESRIPGKYGDQYMVQM